MITELITLAPTTPGQRHQLTVLRYGQPGRGPKAFIQAALHADEIPALLVAQKLRSRLAEEEAAGRIQGEVVLVPYANPLGLSQHVLGHHHGRFDLRDGLNFNRFVPDVTAAVAQALTGKLGESLTTNEALVRQALRHAAGQLTSQSPAADLKNRLLQLALDAHIVLDLHCDSDAVVHLYALTPQGADATELGARLGARAVLLATESGDSPFDEACTRPWLQLQQLFPDTPLPLGCFASTVELRGEADTRHELADADANGIVEFLRSRGVLAGVPAPLPEAACQATPLSGSEPILAPHAGAVVFRCAPGEVISAGTVVADVVDLDTGLVTPVPALSAGVLYARSSTRWATPGKRLAKVAGTTLARTGKLLSA